MSDPPHDDLEALRRQLESLWAQYQHATGEEKQSLLEQYLAALRRFAELANPC
ncbi:MAG TPA: hypothetical protein VKE70_14405 [Candidatus Solibacter sp.]|nr:hypothetical protein [Candidatus Solibacter sp.]